MPSFKITKIDKTKGHVSVIFDVDGVEQTMGDAPLHDEAALKDFLSEYGKRYEEAKAAEARVVPREVENLVGKDVVFAK